MKEVRNSKLRQEPKKAKPSDKLRREPLPATSGQVGPMSAKPPKQRGLIRAVTQTARAEASAKVHQKISQAEHENVGVEAAHKAELYVERAGRTASRHIGQRVRTRPARRAARRERTQVKANMQRFRQTAHETPVLPGTPLKRQAHKKRIQKKQQAEEKVKAAAKRTASATQQIGHTVITFVRKNKGLIMILSTLFLLITTLQSCMGLVFTLGSGVSGAITATTYLAEDEDIDSAELRYTEWEVDLEIRARDAEYETLGYDEYRYFIDPMGHDPYALMAYLTTKYNDFTFAQVQGDLWAIFHQQYTLAFTPTVETRYRWETFYDYYTGEPYDELVPYDYYILTTTLTARPFEGIIMPLLLTEEEQERYTLYMLLHGNRQLVGSPFPFNWLPYVSSNYGYRIHPISGEKDYHAGVDIAMPIGVPIFAGGDGIILESWDNGGYGLMVLVDYGNGITARYAHCSAVAFSAGDTVKQGDVIALSGNSGSSTGPHLHFEVHKNGRPLNPLYFADGTIGGY